MNTTDINIGMAGFRGSVPIVEIASGEPKPESKCKVYTVADLEEMFGVTRCTILRWEAKGKLPKRIQFGFRGKVLFKRELIDAMIERGEI